MAVPSGSPTRRVQLVLGLIAMMFEKAGSWRPVFAIIICMDVMTGLLALFVLKPLRRSYAAK
jgi:hypothetical protein